MASPLAPWTAPAPCPPWTGARPINRPPRARIPFTPRHCLSLPHSTLSRTPPGGRRRRSRAAAAAELLRAPPRPEVGDDGIVAVLPPLPLLSSPNSLSCLTATAHSPARPFLPQNRRLELAVDIPCPWRPCCSPPTNQPIPASRTPPASFPRPPRPFCITYAPSRALGEPPDHRTPPDARWRCPIAVVADARVPGRWILIQRQLTVSFN